ncbi:MAG: glycogen-binding domain-containing protein [Spirochaetaceae bacterium]|jgi:hypothetical protein|nr:glycogen-binding domain-containing protein [Spirochaetaceae bacterium]
MKHKLFGTLMLLLIIIGKGEAQNRARAEYSDELSEYLLTLTRPAAPVVLDGQVLFTLPSTYRRAGVAFAHENWTEIHWFRKLELPIDDVAPYVEKSKVPRQFYHDSGIMFTVYTPPPGTAFLEYRLIADGLWIADPLNSESRLDTSSGVKNSLVYLDRGPNSAFVEEARKTKEAANDGRVRFRYDAEPGSAVYLTGSFNNWDPFMYEMREEAPGAYTLALGLPPGTYQYVFFDRGLFYPDLSNPERIHLLDGRIASVLAVE